MMTVWTAELGEQMEKQAPQAQLLAAIRMAREGDHRAFEEMMILSQRRVAGLAWKILGDAEEVKEATQETFLRVYRHLHRYDETRDFFGWLFRITVNVCRDLERRRTKRSSFVPLDEATLPPTHPRMDEALQHRADMALLARAIDALPQRERLALILKDVEEMSTESVAAALGNTPATVRVQVSKARAKLREWFRTNGKESR